MCTNDFISVVSTSLSLPLSLRATFRSLLNQQQDWVSYFRSTLDGFLYDSFAVLMIISHKIKFLSVDEKEENKLIQSATN